LEIGEDGFMLGLFADVPGKTRNLIAARFRNAFSYDDTPVKQPNANLRPAHIFDTRSRPGFSGSPVFIYRTPAGDLRSATERGRDKIWRRSTTRQQHGRGQRPFGNNDFDVMEDFETEENAFLMLLGLHAGARRNSDCR
jgi:hypothetical protein